MYTHSLDRSPELEKLFNMYSKKSEVSIILCVGDNVYSLLCCLDWWAGEVGSERVKEGTNCYANGWT